MAPHSNETANFGDEAKVATAPPVAMSRKKSARRSAPTKDTNTDRKTKYSQQDISVANHHVEALESQAESKPEMKSDKKSATQLESIVRPVAERQESSHEYSGTGLDETPKSPTRGHYRTPSLNAARRRGSRQEDGGATNYARASGSVRSDNSDETVHTLVNGADRHQDAKADDKDTGYPPLILAAQGQGRYERHAWKAGGIRFVPLRVPVVRRLQMAAVLMHTVSILALVSFFFFLAAIPLNWPLLVPYLIHLSLSTAPSDGRLRFRSEFLRSLPVWRLFAGYYPAELHKTYELPPTRKYIFGYHPHGIISHGAWAAFATNALGFRDKFPGITNTLLTLDSNFRIPFYRDWILAMGIRSVSKESIWNTLTRGGPNNEGMGRGVTIVIGGARESLEAQPGHLRLIIKGRKGFIKMALRTGADLVPVLAFGENDLYDQLSPRTHPMVHRVQMFLLNVFKFTLPALHGRGILNYDVGVMPYRRPLNIVVGKPIRVAAAMTPQPDQADIDRLHALYVAELQKLWETYKDQFAKDRTSEMTFIG
ncbi:diacylglycerol O-acyltransferase 2B [Verticillium dahliae VdLs.17]|uniref:diacylglycerol O-acyltransferase n=1 Tax=Verticillium dahliae (strain VdLs.17 / ATCC MYA-4575 / FGSC 10137) TaxID=498257 RepID=G2X030_VERDV|nr:diacylglycerol O-acyltransferase 2B [Verticillium dahliae VdLs.17]EGY21613.1 diacylglycerol O-acyltransferase 2B [Verticillium dahliae VdLs.17]KAF3344976.1 Cellobiose dehydrogenase [Verticillium dahliae VDG2]